MRMNTKLATAVTAGVIVLAGGGVAVAYWTATGTGAGSAATSAGVSDLTITQTSTISDLRPGGGAQDIEGSVTNNANFTAFVNTVTVAIDSVTTSAGAPIAGCDATDYTLTGAVMTVAEDIAADGGTASFDGATIAFNNKSGVNQDACQGAVVHLGYTAA